MINFGLSKEKFSIYLAMYIQMSIIHSTKVPLNFRQRYVPMNGQAVICSESIDPVSFIQPTATLSSIPMICKLLD